MSNRTNPRFPWGKLLLGAVAGMAIVELAPRIIKFLDSIPPAPLPILPPTSYFPERPDPSLEGHPSGSAKKNFPSSASESRGSLITTPPEIWTPPADAHWLRVAPHPSVILVLGKRGSGKSALGYRLLELFRDAAVPYVVGIPLAARKLLPQWVGVADRLEDVPPQAVVLMDEAYLQLHARNSMSEAGRTIGPAVNLSRQRGQTIIFIVQEARQLDVNVISQADVIAVKELSEISREFERRELHALTDKARAEFKAVRGDRRCWTWVYSEKSDYLGLVENKLATFWRPALSNAFAGGSPMANIDSKGIETTPKIRKGERTPREELAAKAIELRKAGFSYGEIGKMLGISKSTAWDLVNGR